MKCDKDKIKQTSSYLTDYFMAKMLSKDINIKEALKSLADTVANITAISSDQRTRELRKKEVTKIHNELIVGLKEYQDGGNSIDLSTMVLSLMALVDSFMQEEV